MESIDPACTEIKTQYEECFNRWYATGYLKGDRDDPCIALFRQYRQCVDGALRARNIDQMLSEQQVNSANLSNSQE